VSQEVTPSTPGVPEAWAGGTWEELTRDATEVFGADLEKGAQLVGIPFCLIMATYRPGFVKPDGTTGFYVSLDAIIGPEEQITRAVRRGRVPEGHEILVDPEEHIVFNEGGTGVYRQVSQFLEASGRIKINSDLPREGKSGESRYDISPAEWDVDPSAEFKLDAAGNPTVGFSIRLLCPRGLRESEYDNEYGPDKVVTRYIA
jgi:hypothetical protein